MNNVPNISLNDNNTIPQLGFGTYQIEPENTYDAVKVALEAGYRHIDTAEMYGNEKEVGQAIRDSGIERSEIFVTTKLNNGFHKPEDATQAIDDSLAALDIEYIDLFLIHWPLPTLYDGDFVSTWNVLEAAKANGKVKSIGVSNFQTAHLEKLAAESDTVPAVNQIELHPYLRNEDVVAYCLAHNIEIEAWSPIAQGGVLEDETIAAIADSHNKTPAQVVLRWHIQHGYIIFPKSVTPERVEENFDIFDFELSTDEMSQIDSLNKGEDGRTGPNPDTFDYIPES